MRVFILDDVRSISAALLQAGYGVDNMPEGTYAVARTLLDARDLIAMSLRFDLWVLDNDLGEAGMDGYAFLKLMVSTYPGKVPDMVWSCSSNPPARASIEAFFSNWIANGRQSPLPIGVDP